MVSDYINFCVESVIPTETSTIFPNNKWWVSKKLKQLRRRYNHDILAKRDIQREIKSHVKSSHLYLYSAFNNTNCDKATAQYQNRKIVSIM